MNSCIFCNFCVSLHLFEDFQHLLFPYIFSKQKGGIIFTQNFAICLIKRTVVSFPLSPYCHKELLVGFVSYIDNQHPRLQRLYAFFFAYVRVLFLPIPTTYMFPLLLLSPNGRKCGNEMPRIHPSLSLFTYIDSDYWQELEKFVSPVLQTFTHLY